MPTVAECCLFCLLAPRFFHFFSSQLLNFSSFVRSSRSECFMFALLLLGSQANAKGEGKNILSIFSFVSLRSTCISYSVATSTNILKMISIHGKGISYFRFFTMFRKIFCVFEILNVFSMFQLILHFHIGQILL